MGLESRCSTRLDGVEFLLAQVLVGVSIGRLIGVAGLRPGVVIGLDATKTLIQDVFPL
jgi:hypothetical protein